MEIFDLIEKVGLPIAGGLVMGYFIFLIMKQLMNNLVDDIKTIQGITKMLITRAAIINNDLFNKVKYFHYLSSPLKLFDAPDVPAYKPNQAAPAPTTTDIKPDCSKFGASKSINHITVVYNKII